MIHDFGDSDDDWEYTPKPMSDNEFDANMDYLKSHPLFMKQLPQDQAGNEGINALQNLMYDKEDPRKIAYHMNEKGKEYVGKGAHKYYQREALKAFDDALLQEFEDDDLRAKIHSNRSLVNYKLKNFGRAIEDARAAIKYDPKWIKPYFRAAQGYFTLEKYEECVKICDEGLVLDPKCKEIIDIKKDADEKLEKLKAKVAKVGEVKNEKFKKLVEEYVARGYILGKNRVHEIPDAYKTDPYPDSENELRFSVILTYIEFNQIDFIQDVSENDLLTDHLKEIFKEKLPWDDKGFYEYKDLAIFVELNSVEPMFKSQNHTNFERGFLRIGRRKRFSDIFRINGYVMPFVLELYVLSKASPFFDKFMKDFDIVRNV